MNKDTQNLSELYKTQVLNEAGGLIDKVRSKIPVGQAGQQRAKRNVFIKQKQKALKKHFDYQVPGRGFRNNVTGEEIQGFFNNQFGHMANKNTRFNGFLASSGVNGTLSSITPTQTYSRRQARKIIDKAILDGYNFYATGVDSLPSDTPSTEIPPVIPSTEIPPVITTDDDEDPPVEDPPVEDPPAGGDAGDDAEDELPPPELSIPTIEDPPVEDPPVEDPPVEDPPVEDPPVEDPPVEDPPVEDPAGGESREETLRKADERGLKLSDDGTEWVPKEPAAEEPTTPTFKTPDGTTLSDDEVNDMGGAEEPESNLEPYEQQAIDDVRSGNIPPSDSKTIDQMRSPMNRALNDRMNKRERDENLRAAQAQASRPSTAQRDANLQAADDQARRDANLRAAQAQATPSVQQPAEEKPFELESEPIQQPEPVQMELPGTGVGEEPKGSWSKEDQKKIDTAMRELKKYFDSGPDQMSRSKSLSTLAKQIKADPNMAPFFDQYKHKGNPLFEKYNVTNINDLAKLLDN